MLNEVRRYIEKHQLLTADKPVIVGLSGGADSVALLSVLCELRYTCIAAHCNFHLRGEESDRDEQFARGLADSFHIPYYKTDFDTQIYAAEKKISIEMAARELRYQWFEQLRMELSAQAIAVAHHEQDNVETVLLNLIRGTGIKGLTGMSPQNGFVVRPLLDIKKTAILDWLTSKGLGYMTDSTNLSDEYSRNFLRIKVIPLLEELNPSLSEAIKRTAENLTETEAIYNDNIAQIRENVLVDDYTIRIQELLNSPAPKTVLYELLKPYGFNRSVINTIYSSLLGKSGKQFYSAGYELLKDRNFLLIRSLSESDKKESEIRIGQEELEVKEPVRLVFSKLEVTAGLNINRNPHVATVDLDKLEYPLVLRKWKEGDWFIPFGMKGKKKLSDFFTDQKMSLFEKENIWLLCSGENIVWIVGKRLDNRFCIEKSTKQALVIHFFE